MNSTDCCTASLRPKKLAPVKAGMDNKKAILLESTLLNFKNLAAVKVIPALLTPGTSAKIWNSPINNIVFIFKLVDILWLVSLLSEINRTKPKNRVVHTIISIFLIRLINYCKQRA